MAEKYRLFVAIDLPETIKDELYDLSDHQDGFHWINPDNYHLTLFFIGEVNRSELDPIASALEEIQEINFNIDINRLDFFGQKREPRVLWAGVEADETLMRLQQSVARILTKLGYSSDRKKFTPHISLAKLRGATYAQIANFLMLHAPYRLESFEVSAFHLYRSHLSSMGAQYQKLESYELLG